MAPGNNIICRGRIAALRLDPRKDTYFTILIVYVINTGLLSTYVIYILKVFV